MVCVALPHSIDDIIISSHTNITPMRFFLISLVKKFIRNNK